ncbi:MAG: phosphoribosylanthranilate isomerase [Rhizobiaceae bacterium]
MDIKICGISTEDALDAVVEGGASHAGFIFFEKSPRNVSVNRAAILANKARGHVKTVAVTVDASDAVLDAIVDVMRPDMLQCHGGELPARIAQLKARFDLPVIKAFSIRSAEDFDRIDPYEGIADLFLFDAKPPAGSQLPGGNGVSFDWSLMDRLDRDLPYMLSGGIGAANVEFAVRRVRPPGLDVSSGVESAPGVKDPALVREFLARVRKLESGPDMH